MGHGTFVWDKTFFLTSDQIATDSLSTSRYEYNLASLEITGLFVSGSMFYHGDTLDGYIRWSAQDMIYFADSTKTIIECSADTIAGFRVGELDYSSVNIPSQGMRLAQNWFLQTINRDWHYPVYAVTYPDKRGGFSMTSGDFPVVSLAIDAARLAIREIRKEKWVKLYLIPFEGKILEVVSFQGNGKIKAICSPTKFARLFESCPEVQAKLGDYRSSYSTIDFLRLVQMCPKH